MREHPSNQRLPFCAVVARARRVIADARGSRARTASARSQLQINAGHVPALLHPRVSCSAHRDAARADTKRPGAEFAGTAVDNAAVHDAAPTASPAAELSNVDAPAGMLPESSQRKRRRSAEHIAWNKITKRTPLTIRTATTGDLLQRFGAMQRTRNHDRRQISRHPPRFTAVRRTIDRGAPPWCQRSADKIAVRRHLCFMRFVLSREDVTSKVFQNGLDGDIVCDIIGAVVVVTPQGKAAG